MIVMNAVYQFTDNNDRIRIIYVSIPEDICSYVFLEISLATPILESIEAIESEIERNTLVEIVDPYMQLIEESSLSEVVKRKREENWQIIEQYWESRKIELLNRATRLQVFKEISIASNISLMTARRIFGRFWQRGMTFNSCLPDYSNSGAPGKEKSFSTKAGRPRIPRNKDDSPGINVDEKVKKQFEIVTNKYFRTKEKKSLRAVHKLLLNDFYTVPIQENGDIKRILKNPSNVPTYGEYYYWFKKNENPGIDTIEREGEKNYELTSRPLLGDSQMEAPGPGFRYQVDSTPDNLHIVSEIDIHKPIGRPIVYFVIDVYSRMITGLYVGLESNSWNGGLMALDSMVANKKELCAEYGIPIDEDIWPCSELPEAIIADRGEFKGHGVENLIHNFKVVIENTSPYRGDMKGIIERYMRTKTEKTKAFCPGAIMKDFRKRGDPDYRLDAALTLKEARKIAILAVIDHNLSPIEGYKLTPAMIKDNVRPIPLEIWNWGIAQQKGCLRKVDRLTFQLGILPRAKASFTRGVVIFHKIEYSASEFLVDYNHLKISDTKVDVIYDPRNLKNIYMVRPDKEPLLLTVLEQSKAFASFSLEDVLEANKKAAALHRSAEDAHLANSILMTQEIQKIAKKAEKEKKDSLSPTLPKSQRLKNIKENRANEKAIQRERETLIPPTVEYDSPAEIIPFTEQNTNPSNEISDNKSKESTIDLIRRRRHEHRKE